MKFAVKPVTGPNSQAFQPSNNPREALVHLDYIDDFRGFAILLVVLTHVYPWSLLPSWGWNIVQNATVFFIFVSGFFLRYLYRESETTAGFFRRKASRVVAPYLLSCLPGVLLVWVTNPDSANLGYFVWTISTGIGHFNDAHWFSPLIVLLFAAYPAWRQLGLRKWGLTVATCFAVLVSLITFRSQGNANPLISFVHFAGVFLAGMLAAQHHHKLVLLLRRRFWMVVTVGFSAWALAMPFIEHRSMEQVLASGMVAVDLSMLAKLILVLPMMAIFLQLSESGRSPALLKTLARMSVGIFFWHYYAIQLVDHWANLLAIHNAYWSIAVRPILVLLSVMAFLTLSSWLFPSMSRYLGVNPVQSRRSTSQIDVSPENDGRCPACRVAAVTQETFP